MENFFSLDYFLFIFISLLFILMNFTCTVDKCQLLSTYHFSQIKAFVGMFLETKKVFIILYLHFIYSKYLDVII